MVSIWLRRVAHEEVVSPRFATQASHVSMRRCCWCRLPRYDTLAFLLLHAGYVSQWAFDYRFYQAGGLSLVDVGIVVAVQQVALVLGRIIPLTRMPCPSWKLPCVRIPRGLRSFAPLALVIATMAKARVDYLRFDIGTVYLTAAGCYAAVVICLLMVGRSGRRRCCSSLAKRVFRERDTTRGSSDEDDGDSASSPRDALSLPRLPGQSLNSRLLWLAFYAESSSRVAMTVSSVSLQTAAILVRVAFPAVVEVPCYQYVPSLPILLVVRLLLEQLAASQASRWPQSCGRLVFLFSGYIVSSMALLLHFQTYVHQGDLCALHMMLAYATSLSCVAGAVRPVWETHLAGFISAAMLVWPVGRIGQFDATLAWASLALMLGCSAATISLAASLFRPTGMHVRFRRRQPARLR
ncbi:hypothetical protein HPB52_018521 [Rhipicephalus sanguineus]|uniref:Uncharacterized protein n=1 Tax=Rhipicephalus sanguineus TaxID=34632 RepID=A0A9D4SP90_RHISA|nr:hypothetical protein HPB52_018521 [Rhipicephalus sanguineus]